MIHENASRPLFDAAIGSSVIWSTQESTTDQDSAGLPVLRFPTSLHVDPGHPWYMSRLIPKFNDSAMGEACVGGQCSRNES